MDMDHDDLERLHQKIEIKNCRANDGCFQKAHVQSKKITNMLFQDEKQ